MSTVRWNGAAVDAAIMAAAESGLFEAASMVAEESARVAPIEEGTLIRSQSVTVDGLTAAISYDTPYAARQHEDLTLTHDAGRQGKYLEQPLREHGGRGMEHVAEAIRGVTR